MTCQNQNIAPYCKDDLYQCIFDEVTCSYICNPCVGNRICEEIDGRPTCLELCVNTDIYYCIANRPIKKVYIAVIALGVGAYLYVKYIR